MAGRLPAFRATVIEYTDTMDSLGPAISARVAVALDLPPDWFDTAFEDSQFSFRLSHYPPVEAEPNQFGIAPHTDGNFMTFLAQTEVPGFQVRMPTGDLAGRALHPRLVRGQFGRHDSALEQRPVQVDAASRAAADRAAALRDPILPRPALRHGIECLPTCQGPDTPPKYPPITYADYLQVVVRRELRCVAPARPRLIRR